MATKAAHLCFALSHDSIKQVKKTSNEQNSSIGNFMLINTADNLFQHSAFNQMVLSLPDTMIYNLI